MHAQTVPRDVALVADLLAAKLGPFHHPRITRNSVTAVSRDHASMLKIYRTIEPLARQQRELGALRTARSLGIRVPEVLDSGQTDGAPWTVTAYIEGEPGDLSTPAGLRAANAYTRQLMSSLHQHVLEGGAGPGWTGLAGKLGSSFLAAQFSARARSTPAWPVVLEAARQLDDSPVVRLHGDIKPEHFIANGDAVHVVDWEASASGPPSCDHADYVFHVVRDLIYIHGRHTLPNFLETDDLAAVAAALAVRVALWADRRRTDDLAIIPSSCIAAVLQAKTEGELLSSVIRAITESKAAGTPR